MLNIPEVCSEGRAGGLDSHQLVHRYHLSNTLVTMSSHYDSQHTHYNPLMDITSNTLSL